MSLLVDMEKQLGEFHLSVQFSAERECLALLGGSGVGKSVTLQCIAGIMKPDEGHIELDGRVLFDSAGGVCLRPQLRQIGYLFQQYALFPNMTARQNIAVAVPDRGHRAAVTEELLRRFQLTDAAEQKPCQLSGGQQQRTALARILASEPKAILLDEPFAALDSYLKYQLEAEMQSVLNDFPGTVLWVTHDRGEAWRSCGRAVVLAAGRAEPPVSMEQLFKEPKTVAAARLTGCKNDVPARPAGQSVKIPLWGVSLQCGRPVPTCVTAVGIHSRHLHVAAENEENTIPCRVVQVIDDLAETVVLLRPMGAGAEAAPLRMECAKEDWQTHSGTDVLTVTVKPADILLLK